MCHAQCMRQSNCFFPDLIIMSHPTHLLSVFITLSSYPPSAMHIRRFSSAVQCGECSHNDPHYISRRYVQVEQQIFSSFEKYPVRHKWTSYPIACSFLLMSDRTRLPLNNLNEQNSVWKRSFSTAKRSLWIIAVFYHTWVFTPVSHGHGYSS